MVGLGRLVVVVGWGRLVVVVGLVGGGLWLQEVSVVAVIFCPVVLWFRSHFVVIVEPEW